MLYRRYLVLYRTFETRKMNMWQWLPCMSHDAVLCMVASFFIILTGASGFQRPGRRILSTKLHSVEAVTHALYLVPRVPPDLSQWAMLPHHTQFEPTLPLAAADLSIALSTGVEKAVRTGKSGARAASIQVLSLMWLRTTLNYQYRYGTNTSMALTTLWEEGGIRRLYQGLPFALIQSPLSRFGDTASNALVLTLLEDSTLPMPLQTACGSVSAALWRIFLTPVDTLKTVQQVEGEKGLSLLRAKIAQQGLLKTLYAGGGGSALATAVGHYPWFFTYNTLSEKLYLPQDFIDSLHAYVDVVPQTEDSDPLHLLAACLLAVLTTTDIKLLTLLRSAMIGVISSSFSDVTSNSLRVLKTVKQTQMYTDKEGGTNKEFSYIETIQGIVAEEGLGGLFGRGLQTRILANALQGALFSVLFKYFSVANK